VGLPFVGAGFVFFWFFGGVLVWGVGWFRKVMWLFWGLVVLWGFFGGGVVGFCLIVLKLGAGFFWAGVCWGSALAGFLMGVVGLYGFFGGVFSFVEVCLCFGWVGFFWSDPISTFSCVFLGGVRV